MTAGEISALGIGLANLALLLRLSFYAGRVVERVDDHGQRIERLEQACGIQPRKKRAY